MITAIAKGDQFTIGTKSVAEIVHVGKGVWIQIKNDLFREPVTVRSQSVKLALDWLNVNEAVKVEA